MKVLIGTTNPAKVRYYEKMLADYEIDFLTLKDLQIAEEPEETGNDPEENARQKAAFYGRYFDVVICNDSGLYFDALALDDPLQPGLHVRTPQGVRLDDDAMVAYYTNLVKTLGGKALAYYLNGFAVYRNGKLYSKMEDPAEKKEAAFFMLDHAVEPQRDGWPLDSISIRNPLGSDAIHNQTKDFLLAALGLEEAK
ncbi:MAG: non-canonical purine NTP pyrophosphatase [Firmicutes bacterium]|nr:non-canonical purine NTP pyrophosphatase [Bacillota bacterium]